jgi:hypothetical protein
LSAAIWIAALRPPDKLPDVIVPQLPPVSVVFGQTFDNVAIGTVVGNIFGIATGATVAFTPSIAHFTVSGSTIITTDALPAGGANYSGTLRHSKSGSLSADTVIGIPITAHPTGGGVTPGDLNNPANVLLFAAALV